MVASTLRMLLVTVALCALVASVCAAPRRPKYQGASSSNSKTTETDEEKKARLQKYIDDQEVAIAVLKSTKSVLQQKKQSDALKTAIKGLQKQIEQSEVKIKEWQRQIDNLCVNMAMDEGK